MHACANGYISFFLPILQEDFEKAAKDALTLPATTTDEDKLILYGLFKQATVGDVNTSKIKPMQRLELYII